METRVSVEAEGKARGRSCVLRSPPPCQTNNTSEGKKQQKGVNISVPSLFSNCLSRRLLKWRRPSGVGLPAILCGATSCVMVMSAYGMSGSSLPATHRLNIDNLKTRRCSRLSITMSDQSESSGGEKIDMSDDGVKEESWFKILIPTYRTKYGPSSRV